MNLQKQVCTIWALALSLGCFAYPGMQDKVVAAKNTPQLQNLQKALEESIWDPYILTRAEELLQADRNSHMGYAQHDLEHYYNQVKTQEISSSTETVPPASAQAGATTSPNVTNSQTPTYYVPLVQMKEEDTESGADGPEAGVYWVEIGSTNTSDGPEVEYFYLISKKETISTNDGPEDPGYEVIVPAIFNEAYRHFAANPRSAKATIQETRQLLTIYYRQVQAEKKNQKK